MGGGEGEGGGSSCGLAVPRLTNPRVLQDMSASTLPGRPGSRVQNLHGKYIFDGSGLLRIQVANSESLNVKYNNERQR